MMRTEPVMHRLPPKKRKLISPEPMPALAVNPLVLASCPVGDSTRTGPPWRIARRAAGYSLG